MQLAQLFSLLCMPCIIHGLVVKQGYAPVALEGMPQAQWRALEQQYAPGAHHLLEVTANGSVTPNWIANPSAVFQAVQVALPLEPPILSYKEGTGGGQGDKNIAGLSSLKHRAATGQPCIIYGLGIADDSGFEQKMAATGCETHAFDCTVDPLSVAVAGKAFKFHQWCIGAARADSQNQEDNIYVHGLVHVQCQLPCDNCAKKIDMISGGGNNEPSKILIDGQAIAFPLARGINLITIDPASLQIMSTATYDVYIAAQKENARLVTDLDSLPQGRIVLMVVHDTGLESLAAPALAAMHRVGASIDGGDFREGYAFVGRVGQTPVAEKRSRDTKMRLQFKTLAETMRELGHVQVHLLKFDIEGYEWQLFQSEILGNMDRNYLPEQMSFELHTHGANPHYVPAELVSGKGAQQVSRLFLSLFDKGYRVISKEINGGDPHCAEFVVLRVN